ncbi:hypothetical protein [Methanobrevibacter sp.]
MSDYSTSKKLSLKYSGRVPEDYDAQEMLFTFDFIYLVLKRDTDIDDAVRTVAIEYGLTEEYLKDYLILNRYILNKTNKQDFSQELKTYNTKALKKVLKKYGIKPSGKRDTLEKRLFENNLLGSNYQLSSKSKIFYKNKKRRIKIYKDYLEGSYFFTEFNEFYMDNFRKKLAKIPVGFINLHISKSIEDKNHDNFISNNQIMADHYLIKGDYKRMLEHVLETFCMNLNPVWKIGDLKNHVGLQLYTYDKLGFLNEKIGKNRIISTYYIVWDSFNFERIIVSKYEGYRYLKDILNQKNFTRINNHLNTKFYRNDNLKIKRIEQKTLFNF